MKTSVTCGVYAIHILETSQFVFACFCLFFHLYGFYLKMILWITSQKVSKRLGDMGIIDIKLPVLFLLDAEHETTLK